MTMSYEGASAPTSSHAMTGPSHSSSGQGANRLWIVTAADGRRFGPAARTDLLVWWEEGRLLPEMVAQDAETGEELTIADALRLPLILEDRQVHTYIHPHEAEMGFLRTIRLEAHRLPEVIKVPGGLFPPGQTRIKYRINAGPRSADGKRRANLVLFISIHPPGKGPVAQPSDVLPATRLQPKPGEMTTDRMPPLKLVPGDRANRAPQENREGSERKAIGIDETRGPDDASAAPNPPRPPADANSAHNKTNGANSAPPQTVTPPQPAAVPDIKYIQLTGLQAAQGGDFAMTLTDGRDITFRVPAGITHGQQLLYPKLGAVGPNHQPTDLLLVIQVAG